MTNAEHLAAIKADADEDMNKLGTLLHEAFEIARKLSGRGVDMAGLGLLPATIQRLSVAAENAYTLNLVKVAV